MNKPTTYHFSAPVEVTTSPDSGLRSISGVPYSGGVITDHMWFSRVAFDLATLSIQTPVPLLLNHCPDDTVGVVNVAEITSLVRITGTLFTGIDEDADSIAAKADAGFPWQMSVGIFPDSIEEIPAGQSVPLNGQMLDGPLTILRNARIREVSLCPVGADAGTSASVFTADPTKPKEANMTTENNDPTIEALREQVVITQATLAERDTTIAELQAQIAQFHAARREEAVKALFADLKREFTADAAKPYSAMTEEQFSAIAADLRSLVPAAGGYLFSGLANGTAPQADARKSAENLNSQVAGGK